MTLTELLLAHDARLTTKNLMNMRISDLRARNDSLHAVFKKCDDEGIREEIYSIINRNAERINKLVKKVVDCL